jgi:hypothetical protein
VNGGFAVGARSNIGLQQVRSSSSSLKLAPILACAKLQTAFTHPSEAIFSSATQYDGGPPQAKELLFLLFFNNVFVFLLLLSLQKSVRTKRQALLLWAKSGSLFESPSTLKHFF